MSPDTDYDIAILGGGPGGYGAALRAAAHGAKVCCVEQGRVGGTCLNVGCIPTKAMLHASELAWQAGHCAGLGLNFGSVGVDGPAFMSRVVGTVDKLVANLGTLIKSRKIDVVQGKGRLVSPNQIAVADDSAGAAKMIQAKSIIIATGSRPARPTMFPWGPRVFTTDEATRAATLPGSVIIVGGGVIGCEFATFYSELGIATSVVEMLEDILKGFDADAVRAMSRSFKARGVNVLTGQTIVNVEEGPGGVKAGLASGQTIEADAMLVAVGRRPNVEDIGLAAAGVELVGGLIAVDDHCRTNVANIYAVGDCAVDMQYAHLATRMGMIAADNATGRDASDDRTVVAVGVYGHPEIASVGLTETKARAICPKLRVTKFPYIASGMANAYAQTEGMVKLMGDPGDGRLLGGLVIGQHATDVIQELALAIRHGLTIGQIAGTIHPHPTFVEAVGEAAQAWLEAK